YQLHLLTSPLRAQPWRYPVRPCRSSPAPMTSCRWGARAKARARARVAIITITTITTTPTTINTTTMVTITAIAIATGLAVPWAAFKPVRSGIVRKLLLRPPATETSHVAGLCLGLPDALHVGQVDHRFRERVSVTQDP